MNTKKILGPWTAESDGEEHDRTYYAVRDSADAPFGIGRVDFKTKEAARRFVRDSNALILRTMNSGK